jgi:hypothetical protein
MAKKFDRLVARGELTDGGLIKYDNPKWVRGMLQQYDPCPIVVLFERRRSSPSAEQRGYLWGVVYPEISAVTGHTPDELHQIMKRLHLLEKHVWRGKEIVTVKSTSELTMGELAEFITNVILTANELGIEIPPADKLYQFH